ARLPSALAADDGALSPGLTTAEVGGELGRQSAKPETKGEQLMGGVAGVGSNHKKANDYVKTFQDPFGKRLTEFSDTSDKARAAGTLDYKTAQESLDQFNQEWTAFDQGSQEYKKMGGGFEKVVNQAYDPTKP